MKHQVMMAVEVDTTAIEQRLESDAYEEVKAALYAEAKKGLDAWTVKRLLKEAIDAFIAENRDVIIEKSVNEMANRIPRFKAFREFLREGGGK